MRKWLPLVAICLGSFMLLIDVTIVNVALPAMADDLDTAFSSLQWVIDAYALTLAALLMGIGALADLVGHRRTYLVGLSVFALSSLACGLAPNVGVLIAARAVQGVGAAAMFATTFALLNAGYRGRERGVAYGIWGAVGGAAAAIGPVIGGLLTEGISWEWIFFVNLPVSVAAIAMTIVAFAPDEPDPSRRVDVAGTVTFTVAAGALTFALIRGNDEGWGSALVVALFAVSVVSFVAFFAVQGRSRHAMLDLQLLHNRTFAGVMVAALTGSFAAFAALTYVSIWLQSVLGLSPLEAGLTGLPLSISAFLTSALVGRLMHRMHPGPLIGGGILLIGVGSILDSLLLHANADWPSLIPGYVIIGIGTGLSIPTMSSTAMATVPPNRGGMAAGAVNTARQLSFAIGIAVLGSVFTARIGAYLSDHGAPTAGRAAHALSGGQAQRILQAVPPAQRDRADAVIHGATVSGVEAALLGAGILGVLAGIAVVVLIRPAAVPARQPVEVAAA
ncbi:MAG TPA: DHA2 family efflux MFS transporter permease subunit [Jatrophihabitans sp.]|nr:DHA2 family efflux MFS transporter permease subunit [Jatrophihabitans sp.]